MKKIILIFLFFFICLTSLCQTVYNFSNKEYSTWKVSGSPICGLGNAYCTVIRSNQPNVYGNYIYEIYFATNSYFPNCQVSKTYIPNIYVQYYDDKLNRYLLPLNFYPFWITVGNTSLVYTLYHPNPYLRISISVGKMEPTNY